MLRVRFYAGGPKQKGHNLFPRGIAAPVAVVAKGGKERDKGREGRRGEGK